MTSLQIFSILQMVRVSCRLSAGATKYVWIRRPNRFCLDFCTATWHIIFIFFSLMFLIYLFLICRGISCLDLLIVDWCSSNVTLLCVKRRGPLGRLQHALQRCWREPKRGAEWMRVGGCGAAVTCNWCVSIWPRCRIRWHWQAVTDWVGSDSDHYKRSCSARMLNIRPWDV